MIQMIIAHRTNARCSDYASSHVFRTGSAALARNIGIESTFEDVKIGALRLGRSYAVARLTRCGGAEMGATISLRASPC